jgi:hypothetical protein
MTALAFEIGFDHYRFSLPLDISRFQSQYRAAIRHGFEAARIQNVTKKRPDLYEKKLLGIRDRALIKNLDVTITVDDLYHQLKIAGDVCPITLKPFTYAENDATDWSVDRIDNQRGYTPDNVVVISRIANQAKSDLDLQSILKKPLTDNDSHDLLQPNDWMRMARFNYPKKALSRPLSMCRLLTNTQDVYDYMVFILLFDDKSKKGRSFIRVLEKFISKDLIQKAKKLAHKRICQRHNDNLAVLHTSPKLYRWVQSFIATMNANSAEFDGVLMECLFA